MASSSLRSSTRSLQPLTLPARILRLAPSRSLYGLTNAQPKRKPQRPINDIKNSPHAIVLRHQPKQYTTNANTTSTPTADDLITEIQDLYEVAKDEFEIATDSTDGSTIYAASDRESARDALNQLCAVYHLYTAKPGSTEAELKSGGGGDAGGVEAAAEADGPAVDTTFDPASVGVGVRDEVRRRVGQRVRELRNAVEVLEERAKAD